MTSKVPYMSTFILEGNFQCLYEFIDVWENTQPFCISTIYIYSIPVCVLSVSTDGGLAGFLRNKSQHQHGGGVVGVGGSSVYSVEGETLRITHVSKRHMGVYYCIASNGVPPSVSKRVAVTVLCKFDLSLFLNVFISTFIVQPSRVYKINQLPTFWLG